MKDLLQYLPKLRGKRIGVYGDLIADEYVYGTINRFSREAPVFIVNYEESMIGLGGAANTINNIHELGGKPIPFGILGKDFPGRTLLASMKEKGIDTDGILVEEEVTTFVKQRVVAGSPHSVKQQIDLFDSRDIRGSFYSLVQRYLCTVCKSKLLFSFFGQKIVD